MGGMSVEASPVSGGDILTAARERVAIAPVPDWVQPCSYAAGFKPKTPASVTHILFDRQVHAERHEVFIRTVVRLETMQAVQNHSQWRLEFSPSSQSVELHAIKIRRGDVETEHANIERIRFLQRETGLEGLVIDGEVTLLLLLEDVRPGDTLEWSYTFRGQSRLMPDACIAQFSIPENIHLGKHHVFVRSADTRPLKWKSSSADFTPVERRENGEICWTWLREDVRTDERDPGTPAWHVAYPWIQISDCTDWQTVATAVSNAWKHDGSTDSLASRVREIEATEPDLPRRVHRAIQYVQDEFRYLSVNLEMGGQIPAQSETVIRRRYGDCKDLAFLLACLLRRLGVTARPVLVNTVLQNSIGEMLPSPNLFNHVVVEYQVGEEKRWVDATCKCQGGDALHRAVPNCGLGLLIDAGSTALVKPPAALSSLYEIREHFLVDTTGESSYLAITIRTQGFYADSFRLEFANEGSEAIAKKRLEMCTRRFREAKRVDTLQYRDDRDANEFLLSEVFEVNGFLLGDAPPGYCWIPIQNWALSGMLPVVPESEPTRKMPLALPHPCKVVHKFEIESPGMEIVAVPAHTFRNEFFEVTGTGRGLQKFTTATFTLTTMVDSVSVAKLPEYQKQVNKVLPAFAWRLLLPVGYPRMRKRSSFGALPPSKRPPPTSTSRPAALPSPKSPTPAPTIININASPEDQAPKARAEVEKVVPANPPSRSERAQKSRSPRRKSGNDSKRVEWVVILIVALIFGAFVLLCWYFGKARGP